MTPSSEAAALSVEEEGVAVVVVVVAFDRLTRSEDPMERAAIVGQIHQAGAKIAIVGAGIQDAGTFAGDIYFSVMGAIAAEESRIKSASATAGHITSAMRGRNPRGVIPFGLTYDGEPAAGRWGIDYERAEVVREIVRRLADDESSGRIGADLDAVVFAIDRLTGEPPFVGLVWLYGIHERHRHAEVRIVIGERVLISPIVAESTIYLLDDTGHVLALR